MPRPSRPLVSLILEGDQVFTCTLCSACTCVCVHNCYACVIYIVVCVVCVHCGGVGMRGEISEADLSKVLPEEVEEEVRQAAEISMGTEVCT